MSSSQSRQMICQYCDDPKPQIFLFKVDGKNVATNLDGSPHKHTKNQLMASATYKTVSPAQSNERQEAIQKAHDENIESQNALTEELRGLKQEIASLREVVEQLVSAYMRVNKNAFG